MKTQANQLETWVRRTQSNPTQLDGILNELTQKTATMEEEIAGLESQAHLTAEQHQKELAVVREQLEEQRDEAVKLRVSSQETQEDRDRMEQELLALSQAYSSLEDEFRRSSTSQTDASKHTPSSTEVSALRAENERLRSSAKEADEWMAQAYHKMNELGTQNASLGQEVSSLTERLNNTASHHEDSLRQELERVSEQERVVLAQVSSLQVQLQSKENDISSLQEQLQEAVTSHEQWREAYDGLEQARVALEQQIEQLSSTDPDLSGRLVELENQVETKSIEIQGLQASLDEARQSFEALAKSNLTNSEILTKLEAARKEVEAGRTRSEEEIYKREATIRELESRLGAGLGAYTTNDIRSRDEEIEELRAANEAAQDWMGKAVEQHRLLQEKLWAATQASNAATSDEAGVIHALKQAIAAEEGRHAETRRLVDALEIELIHTKTERDELRTEMSLMSDNFNGTLTCGTACQMLLGSSLISSTCK
jgi:chromosome segregation ATPase